MRSIEVAGEYLPLGILRVWNDLTTGRAIAETWRSVDALLEGDWRAVVNKQGLVERYRTDDEVMILRELSRMAKSCLEELKWDAMMPCFASNPATKEILPLSAGSLDSFA